MRYEDLYKEYELRRPLLVLVAEELRRKMEPVLERMDNIDQMVFCVKPASSFVEKALHKHPDRPIENPLAQIQDQVRCRIVVFSLPDLQAVKEWICDTFDVVESSFRHPARDEEFGYESHHVGCRIPSWSTPKAWTERENMPEVFEVQLRTLFMHAWAEQQHRLVYKRKWDLPHEARKVIAWTAASAWAADRAIASVWDWERLGKMTGPCGEARTGRDCPPIRTQVGTGIRTCEGELAQSTDPYTNRR